MFRAAATAILPLLFLFAGAAAQAPESAATASVNGRIVDAFGTPVAGATVIVSRRGRLGGVLKLIPAGSSPTTSRPPDGNFQVTGLAEGSYYIEVHPPVTLKHPAERTRYLVTLFPGTASFDDARTVTVGSSEIVAGLTVPLAAATVARVSGIAVDRAGVPLTTGSVAAIPRHAELAGFPPTYSAPLQPDGRFALDRVVPGDYLLRAPLFNRSGEFAELAVAVGAADIDDVRITAAPLMAVSGRLVTGPAGAILSVASLDGDGGAAWGPPSIAKPDRSFAVPVRPGRYLLRAEAVGWTMTRITLGGLDVTEIGVEVQSGEPVSGVEVEMTNGMTAVGGFVVGGDGRPAVGATIVIFDRVPEHWRSPLSNVRTATTDGRGAFTMPSLRPGAYYAVAVRPGGTIDFTAPPVLEMLRRRAAEFAIGAGEVKELGLTLASID